MEWVLLCLYNLTATSFFSLKFPKCLTLGAFITLSWVTILKLCIFSLHTSIVIVLEVQMYTQKNNLGLTNVCSDLISTTFQNYLQVPLSGLCHLRPETSPTLFGPLYFIEGNISDLGWHVPDDRTYILFRNVEISSLNTGLERKNLFSLHSPYCVTEA